MPGAEPKPQRQIFLSYSRNDQQAAIAMRSALEQQGLSVFHDIEAIRAGDNWMNALQDSLKNCSGFVLLAGRDGVRRWINAEMQVALNRHYSVHDDANRLPVFPVLLEGASYDALPPFLQLFQITRWSTDEPVPQALLDVVASGVSAYDKKPFEGCPYLGLNTFQREHAPLFFGRRFETLQAIAGLGDQNQTNPKRIQSTANNVYFRWLQVEGNSGSGKSSLVNAGMLPMIEQGALWPRTSYEKWHVFNAMMPGNNPLNMLARTLVNKENGIIKDDLVYQKMIRELEAGESALANVLIEYSRDDTAFLLVIDQFEELFTFAEEQPRKQFDALLAYALQDPQCPLFVITTVRADFLNRFEMLPRLQQPYNAHCKRYYLPKITEQGLREIIEQPANLAGLDVSDVKEMIVRDAVNDEGSLPLVENALHYLWEHRENNKLSAQLYVSKGSLAGLLSKQADILLRQLGDDRQYALRLLLRLTRINNEGQHTRKRITLEDAIRVAGKGERGEKVVWRLSGRPDENSHVRQGGLPLITVIGPQGDNNGSAGNNSQKAGNANHRQQNEPRSYVDLIHETLVRPRCMDEKTGKPVGYWPTLYNYIDDNRDNDLHLQQLQYQSENWAHSGRLGKWGHLATLRERKQYKKLDIGKDSREGRFLFWSRAVAWAQMLVLLSVLGVFGESAWWAHANTLPFSYTFVKPLWQLGYEPKIEMVELPAGKFRMGCVSGKDCNDNEKPVHEVTIAKPFDLGKFEVTFQQYDWYVWKQKGSGVDVSYPPDAGFGRHDHPVINVSWNDAQAYIEWLNQYKNAQYRLPTEAEWEYAARAGSETVYSWGDEVGTNKANCDGCGSQWDNIKTAPVGSFQSNKLGLHDMHGNVWEWVQDAWHENYNAAPVDGSARESTEVGSNRVVRGGSWILDGRFVRSAYRYFDSPDNRLSILGFRLALGH